MCKRLALLRHGESENGTGYQGDFKRKLTENGRVKLSRLNRVLKEKGTRFDLLLKSPALRTMQTAQLIAEHLKVKEERIEENIYESSVEVLLELLYKLPDDVKDVLVVGHNPAISSLLIYLTNDYNVSLMPGMMAVLTFENVQWALLSKGSGCLSEVLQ